MKKILLTSLFCFIGLLGMAQQSTYINTTFDINADKSITWYGDVTFGPNAVVYIEDGALAIFYGKNMVIDPGAKFIALPGNNQIGTGIFVFRGNNPNYPGYPLQQTLNGGHIASVDPSLINIEIDNPAGVSLSGNVRVANQVKFTQGHIFLNNFNLILGNTASLVNFDVNKHVVTNGSGVLTKEAIANGASFQFPVSIAGLDFTPATITNTGATRAISVQVKDYLASTAVETSFSTKGIDRTWQVSSNIAGTANVTLQHNTQTNANGASTNGGAFNNLSAYVSQQLTAGVWSENCTGSNGGSPISITSGNTFVIPAAVDATAYFTKNTVSCVDLRIAKTVNNATPFIGSNLTFTITASNLSAIAATGVLVNDLLPSGYTLVSAVAGTGTYTAATGVWTIGNLAANASATLTVVATVNASGNYANTATIRGNETDPEPTNNSATVTPLPGVLQANLGVTKTVNNPAPTSGTNVVFTILANNVGPNAASGVTVTDVLPAGYTFVSANATTGVYSSATGIWSIGNFANGANATLTITATVKSTGPYANTATIAGNELDPVTGNNSSTVSIAPLDPLVNLIITKEVTSKIVSLGEEFEYIIKVRNASQEIANLVTALDVLREGLTFVSAATTYGTTNYNTSNRTFSWLIGDLAAGSEVTLNLRVRSRVRGIISNTATVSSKQVDTDLSNNTATVTKDILDLIIPNTFTPNGDGKNDTFVIPGLAEYPDNTLEIFNRWGSQVFRSGAGYKNDWTGNGLNEGTYFYILRITGKSNKVEKISGWVLLLRD